MAKPCDIIYKGIRMAKSDFIKGMIDHLNLTPDEMLNSINYLKSIEYAVSEQKSDVMGVSNQTALGEGVVERIPKPEELTGESVQAESKVTGKEEIGITHAALDRVAEEFGFGTYQTDPETLAGWDFEASKRLREDPNALRDLFDRLRSGDDKIDHIDNRMMIQYMADLKAKINKNPTDALLKEFKQAKDLFDIEGRAWGKAGKARQGTRAVEETLGDFLIRDMDANRAPLTEKQKAKTIEQFEKIEAAKQKFEQESLRQKEEQTTKKAEGEIEKIKKTAKKDAKKDYKTERKDIIDQMRADLLKVAKGGGGAMSSIPGLAQLTAAAPHIAKLVRNLVEDGIHTLPEVIKAVHREVKDLIDGISEKDIHNIIAGEYNKPKPKRSAVAEKVFDLQTEAKLINQLEALERGTEPKNERHRVKRNQKIEALRKKIKEHDLTKLAAYKKRVQTQIAELKKQLATGDFAKEEAQPIKLDKAALEARDELLRLREEREIEILKKEYAARPDWQKVIDIGGQAIRTGKVIKSSFDVSFLGRQTVVGASKQLLSLPFKKVNGEWKYTGFESQQQLKSQIGGMYRSFASEKVYRRIAADMKQSPRFEEAQKAGLDLSDPNSPLAKFREDEFQKSFADYVPGVKQGVKASNRAASAISNQMKWDIYNQFVEGFEQKGMTFRNSPDAYKEAAKYANQLVGRGFLGQKVEMAHAVTSPILWSLRLQASRLQLLTKFMNPRFYSKVPREIRIAYLKDMAKFIGTGVTVLALANAAGASVELDPRSADFGVIKIGETRYDIWGGFKQYVVLFSRLFSGSVKKGENIEQLRSTFADEIKFGENTRADVLGRFLRTKLTPELGLGLDLLSGQGFDKKPISPGGAALEFITPLLYKDFTEAMKDGGLDKAFITTLLSIHGIGAQTHNKDEEDSGLSGGKKPTKKSNKKKPIKK